MGLGDEAPARNDALAEELIEVTGRAFGRCFDALAADQVTLRAPSLLVGIRYASLGGSVVREEIESGGKARDEEGKEKYRASNSRRFPGSRGVHDETNLASNFGDRQLNLQILGC
jgi:hypothetical protein